MQQYENIAEYILFFFFQIKVEIQHSFLRLQYDNENAL